jgi:hypothetical protein
MTLPRLTPAAACLAFAMLLLSLGGGARAEVGGLKIELNKLEQQDNACRAYLVFNNATDQDFQNLTLDLYIFGNDGTIAKRLAVNGAPLPPGKTRVALFDIRDMSCDAMNHILISDVIRCEDGSGSRDDCVSLIEASSRSETRFFK